METKGEERDELKVTQEKKTRPKTRKTECADSTSSKTSSVVKGTKGNRDDVKTNQEVGEGKRACRKGGRG